VPVVGERLGGLERDHGVVGVDGAVVGAVLGELPPDLLDGAGEDPLDVVVLRRGQADEAGGGVGGGAGVALPALPCFVRRGAAVGHPVPPRKEWTGREVAAGVA
jgi:hypothetical protein